MRCRGSAAPSFLPSLPSDLHCPCPVSLVTYGAKTRSGCELLKRRLFPSLHPHSSCFHLHIHTAAVFPGLRIFTADRIAQLSPALAGGFSTTGPPGKSWKMDS